MVQNFETNRHYRFLDGPVREVLSVTEMPEVVDVAEELILQLLILDDWHRTVLHVGRERVNVMSSMQ